MFKPDHSFKLLLSVVLALSFLSINAAAAPAHPGFLSPQVSHGFQEYLAEDARGGFKLFMVAGNGTFAWAARSTFEAAFQAARGKCSELRSPWRCDLYAVGDTVVWGLAEKDKAATIANYLEQKTDQRSPPHASLPAASGTPEGAKAFAEYSAWDEGPNLFKVFILSESGAWSWSARFSYEAALHDAIEHCEQAPGSRRGLCHLYSIGDTVVWELPEQEIQSVVSTYQFGKTDLGPPATEAPLGVRTLQAFRAYQQALDYKFFAIGGRSWGTSNRDSFELALEETMDTCRQYANRPCELFAIGDTVVWGFSEQIKAQVMDAYRARN